MCNVTTNKPFWQFHILLEYSSCLWKSLCKSKSSYPATIPCQCSTSFPLRFENLKNILWERSELEKGGGKEAERRRVQGHWETQQQKVNKTDKKKKRQVNYAPIHTVRTSPSTLVCMKNKQMKSPVVNNDPIFNRINNKSNILCQSGSPQEADGRVKWRSFKEEPLQVISPGKQTWS